MERSHGRLGLVVSRTLWVSLTVAMPIAFAIGVASAHNAPLITRIGGAGALLALGLWAASRCRASWERPPDFFWALAHAETPTQAAYREAANHAELRGLSPQFGAPA